MDVAGDRHTDIGTITGPDMKHASLPFADDGSPVVALATRWLAGSD